MPDQDRKGFTVSARRDADKSQESRASPQGPNDLGARGAPDAVEGPGWKMRAAGPTADGPPLPADFTTFCLSMASAALIHLGDAPSPETGETAPNLALARQTIDTLAMLRDKSRGNLSGDEQKLVDTLLYDLRMRFVSAGGRSA